MKILLTTHQFFPEFGAGTEVLTFSIARNLIARGHEVHVLTAYPTEQKMPEEERFDEYQYEGIHVYRFFHSYTLMAGQRSKAELSFDNYLAAKYFKRILEVLKPDVVHFLHLNRLGTGLIEHAVRAGVPSFMTPTDFWIICHFGQLALPDGTLCAGPSSYSGNCVKHSAQRTPKGSIGRTAKWLPTISVGWLARLSQLRIMAPYQKLMEVRAVSHRLATNVARVNHLTKIISPNSFMTEKLVQYGVSPNLIVQSAYGIDMVGQEASTPRQASHQPFRVGYIGTLAPHKGCHVLIAAFKALRLGAATLKIYGNTAELPEYSNELKQLAADQNNIEFCGVFHNSKIAEVMADIDVLVVPSLWFENTPLVLYSAQAAKCPVIASDYPGISQVIQHDLNGLLFEPGNQYALLAQLSRLINEHGLASRLSNNAQQPKSTASYVNELLRIWAAG